MDMLRDMLSFGERINYIRPSVSGKLYAELAKLGGPELACEFVNEANANKLIKRVLRRINTERKKQGRRPLSPPRLIVNNVGHSKCYISDNEIKCNWRPGVMHGVKDGVKCVEVYTLIHELAHNLHKRDALGWMIPRFKKGTDNTLDWHGSAFVRYLQWQRDYLRKNDCFPKLYRSHERKMTKPA
jgi:hypothetical protein